MSEPTVAPAPAAAAPTQPAPTPAPAPAAPPAAAPSATDPAAEIARLTAELETWKGHSRGWETKAKANLQAAQANAEREAKLAEVAKALGLPDPTPSAEQIAQQLTAAQQSTAQLARENAVLRAASAAGADPNALLDSRSFLDSIKAVDPTDTAAVQAAVQAAVAANPRYAATGAAPAGPQQPAAPVQMATAAGQFGQPAGNEQWTADDVAKASPAALSKAMAGGRLTNYLRS